MIRGKNNPQNLRRNQVREGEMVNSYLFVWKITFMQCLL